MPHPILGPLVEDFAAEAAARRRREGPRALSTDQALVGGAVGRYELLRYVALDDVSPEVLAVSVGPRWDASDAFRASLADGAAVLALDWSIGVSRWSARLDLRGGAVTFGLRATEFRLAVLRTVAADDAGYMQAGVTYSPHRPRARWTQRVEVSGAEVRSVPVPPFARSFSFFPSPSTGELVRWSCGPLAGSTEKGAPVLGVELADGGELAFDHNQPEAPERAAAIVWELEL